MNSSTFNAKNITIKTYSAIVHASRLKHARINKGFTQKKVAELIGVYESQFSLYENAKSEIPLHFVFILAQLYDVSSDYLLGLVDVDNSMFPKNIEKHELKLIKQKLMEFV